MKTTVLKTALLVCLLAANTALGQVQITEVKMDDPKAAYTHQAGFVFPTEVGDMPRYNVLQYDVREGCQRGL